MINRIPDNWEYSNELETLFFFYQASEEMLSFVSPDTYRHTVHNTLTLCNEIETIYQELSNSLSLDRYYSKYIPVIIDELIESIHNNRIIKSKLGLRLNSVLKGLERAKNERTVLIRWIRLIYQSCTMEQYSELCKAEIIKAVCGKPDKKELLFFINDYYVSIINLGYNEEYLYQTLIHFFSNKSRIINSPQVIEEFFKLFDFSINQIELYIIADTFLSDNYIQKIPGLGKLIEITPIEEDNIRTLATRSRSVQVFYDNYKLKNRENISMISYKTDAIDPYKALERLEIYFALLQTINGYYKHKAEKQLYFEVLYKASDTWFYHIRLRGVIPKRPFIKDETIDKRTIRIIEGASLSQTAFNSFFSALSNHLDAISCRNEETMLLTFWTAIETVFYESVIDGDRDNAINSLLHIIEKTYLLKTFRILYSQIAGAISIERLKLLNISSFNEFMLFFARYNYDTDSFRKITALLQDNPLLRYRIYSLRKDLQDSKHIRKKLSEHTRRIQWQLYRVYRTRNLITHVGKSMSYINEILFNIHNYFDYVINYIICKVENDDYITSISSLVFEAKNDNLIYMETLKKENILNENNYKELLFGADPNLVNYDFEIADFSFEQSSEEISDEEVS